MRGDSITFTGGVVATAPSSKSIGGTINSTDAAINFGGAGNITLTANTTLSSGAGNITLGGTVDADAAANNRTLTLNSTGITTLGGAVGGTQALLILTTNAGGNDANQWRSGNDHRVADVWGCGDAGSGYDAHDDEQ